MFKQRKIGDRIFHHARTEDTKEEARIMRDKLISKGYKVRVLPVTFYFSNAFEIYTFPKEAN